MLEAILMLSGVALIAVIFTIVVSFKTRKGHHTNQ